MASGKSLELKKIRRREPQKLCSCGKPWADHLRKDGKPRAQFVNNSRHRPPEEFHTNRAQRRRMLR